MGEVIEFRRDHCGATENQQADGEPAANDTPVRRAPALPYGVKAGCRKAGQLAGRGLSRFLRGALFFVLLWIRRPVQFCLGLLAFPALLAAGALYFWDGVMPNKNSILVALVGTGVGAVALSWGYDRLLAMLSGETIFFT